MSDEKALVPVEQKEVDFMMTKIVAVMVEVPSSQHGLMSPFDRFVIFWD